MLLRGAIAAAAALVVLWVAPAGALAQEAARPTPRDSGSAAPDLERRARLARRGGGVRVGTWDVRDMSLQVRLFADRPRPPVAALETETARLAGLLGQRDLTLAL